MQNIASYLLSNAFSAFSPIMNTASAICSVNGQQIPCDDQLSGALGIGMGVFFLIMLVLVVLIIVGTWKVYKKAGEPGWACIIPIYNIIVLLQIVKKPIWWIVLFFIPIVNVIMSIVVMHNLSKSFGKDVGYTLLSLIHI